MANFDINFRPASIAIGGGTNSVIDYFEYRAIKSIGRVLHTDGNWYVIINFFSNDGLNPLKINLAQVANQATWTNTSAGSIQAVGDIQTNIDNYIKSVTIDPAQFTQVITPNISTVTGANGSLATACKAISFASNGTAAALVSFNGGVNYVSLAAGTTVNMDSGGLDNEYAANKFYWNTTTNAGSSLIITYNS
jgi:hypothetical protein